jgi:hypothetical protein
MIILLLALGACNDPSPGVVSLDPNAWTIGPVISGTNYSPGMPLHPSAAAGGGWQFDFPKPCNRLPDCSVHYVTAAVNSIKPSQSVSAAFTVTASADAVFNCAIIPNNPEGYTLSDPTAMSLMLEHTNDDMSYEFWRYFAWGSRTKLAAGTYAISVPLTLDRWIDVMGKPAQSDTFSDTLNHLGAVALVFGGCGYAGHGVQITSGSARFALKSYAIK